MARYNSVDKGAALNAAEDKTNIYSSRQDYEYLSDALADTTARLGDRFSVGNFSAAQLSGLLAFEWIASGTGDGLYPHDTLSLVARVRPTKIITDEMFGGDSTAAQAYVAANTEFVYIDDVVNPTGGGGTLGGTISAGDTYSIRLLDETLLDTSNINISSSYATINSTNMKGAKHFYTDLRNTTAIMMNDGVVRVKFKHRSSTSGQESRARILKNGVEVQEWSTTTTVLTERSVDISIAYGDDITLQHRLVGTGGSYVLDLRFSAAENNLAVV